MKRALPMNSILFIRGDTGGIYLFRMSPARKAPQMPLTPAASAKAALMKSIAMTKMNCMTASEYRRRNQRVSLGTSHVRPAQ